MDGYKAIELTSEENSKVGRSLWAQCQAVADMKFTYVVSCQQYGIQKRSGDSRAQDILRLMTTYALILCFGVKIMKILCDEKRSLVAHMGSSATLNNHVSFYLIYSFMLFL